jgi:hypothetical protein
MTHRTREERGGTLMIRKSYGKAAIDGKVLLLVDLHKGGNVKVSEEEENASQKGEGLLYVVLMIWSLHNISSMYCHWNGSIRWKLYYVTCGKLSECCRCVISVNCGRNQVTK